MPDSERYCCPMCGWWRTAKWGIDQKTGEPREVRFDKVDPAVAPMWRRERFTGAGRASKNARIETIETKALIALPDDMKAQIREQCQRILDVLEDASWSLP